MSDLVEIGPPDGPVYRVARRADSPFAPPSWEYATADGTFGNRFDDASGRDGIPERERFRTIYCSTQRAGAFGETLARYRRSVSLIDDLQRFAAARDAAESVTEDLDDSYDPEHPERRLLPASWRLDRYMGVAWLDPSLRFVDITRVQSLNHLGVTLAVEAHRLGITDVDLSIITSAQRAFTQACARYVYLKGFAGIRYLSRLNTEWECWAFFIDRARILGEEFPESIHASDTDLLAVARLFHLTIEGPRGHYLRP